MTLLEAVEKAHSTAGFGGFRAFGFGFAFAGRGFTGRDALLSNEHAIDFDAGGSTPAALPSTQPRRSKFTVKAAH
jgi:hypothetical protein